MVAPEVKLSILDRSRTRAGYPDAAGVTGTVDRARWAEEFGYQRFWVAEHHGVPGIASGSPAVLLAAIGAATSRICLGSGGVMLPNHQPLVVAEQFLMLASLYPGRIDLGVGRSLGFTPPVRAALRRGRDEPDTFATDIAELGGYLGGTAEVTARPRVDSAPAMFVLATGAGLDIAAAAGLPVVVGGPALRRADLLDKYRREFVPTAANSRPYVVISTEVMIADSAKEAQQLLIPEAWAMAKSRQSGDFPALDNVRDVPADASPKAREQVTRSVESAVSGTAADVSSALDRLCDLTAADELLVSTSTFDREALRFSDQALAGL